MRPLGAGLLLLAFLGLTYACNDREPKVPEYGSYGIRRLCVDGVVYLREYGALAVQVDRSGRPVPCEAK